MNSKRNGREIAVRIWNDGIGFCGGEAKPETFRGHDLLPVSRAIA